MELTNLGKRLPIRLPHLNVVASPTSSFIQFEIRDIPSCISASMRESYIDAVKILNNAVQFVPMAAIKETKPEMLDELYELLDDQIQHNQAAVMALITVIVPMMLGYCISEGAIPDLSEGQKLNIDSFIVQLPEQKGYHTLTRRTDDGVETTARIDVSK